ncbi:hypothetical protein EXIGLDRAFT_783683 [Exidia glandulosa HHB12029]|uniref:Uncharacterized protein n=1 Tax=Exidia glandulosa HHB12029 TaxID=1314781 RepID=A0A166MXK3_EXIGL|nr:hypothetical protein EXIGLDRAFT_783683 [Exidia glandulosa HHB12029]
MEVSALTAQYASISVSLAQVTSVLGPASASASHPPHSIVPADQRQSFPLSIPLSLDTVPSNSPLYKLLPSQLKTTLDAAISKSNVPAATGSHVHSVKRDCTRLFAHTISLSQKEALVKFSNGWLPALGAGVASRSAKSSYMLRHMRSAPVCATFLVPVSLFAALSAA